MYSLDILEIVLHLYLQPEIRQLGGVTGIDGMYSFFVSGACVGHAKNWQSIQMAHVTICQHLPNVLRIKNRFNVFYTLLAVVRI